MSAPTQLPGRATSRPGAPGAPARTTMRAAVLAAPRTARIDEVAIPEPGPRQVVVALEACGVCASNLPVWEGRPWFEYPQAPGAPGHEGWGTVVAVGDEVRDVAVGTRVAALSYRAYAEYDVAEADAVVPLPDALRDAAVPGEPLGCAVNVVRRSAIEPGQTVAVIGIGFLGAVVARLAARAGARVVAISRRPFALDVARELGAHEAIVMDDHARIVEDVRRLTDGRGCERVIECVGLQWPLDLAGELTAERGRLVIAGFHQDGPRQVNMQLWNWRGLDVVNAHERDPGEYVRGIREAVALLESGDLDVAPLLTHRFPLDELDRALATSIERPDGFLKAVVTT